MKLKAVFFDMDGVLIDSMPAHVDSWKRSLEEVGLNQITRAKLLRRGGLSYKETVEQLAQEENRSFTDEEIYSIKKRKDEIYHELESTYRPFEGVFDILDFLREKEIEMFIVTGAQKHIAKVHFELFFQSQYFKDLISVNDVQKGKPAPDSYLKALEISKRSPKECIVIEDSPLGITSGKKAGLRVLALETSLPREELQEADNIFENHQELFFYLKNIIE